MSSAQNPKDLAVPTLEVFPLPSAHFQSAKDVEKSFGLKKVACSKKTRGVAAMDCTSEYHEGTKYTWREPPTLPERRDSSRNARKEHMTLNRVYKTNEADRAASKKDFERQFGAGKEHGFKKDNDDEKHHKLVFQNWKSNHYPNWRHDNDYATIPGLQDWEMKCALEGNWAGLNHLYPVQKPKEPERMKPFPDDKWTWKLATWVFREKQKHDAHKEKQKRDALKDERIARQRTGKLVEGVEGQEEEGNPDSESFLVLGDEDQAQEPAMPRPQLPPELAQLQIPAPIKTAATQEARTDAESEAAVNLGGFAKQREDIKAQKRAQEAAEVLEAAAILKGVAQKRAEEGREVPGAAAILVSCASKTPKRKRAEGAGTVKDNGHGEPRRRVKKRSNHASSEAAAPAPRPRRSLIIGKGNGNTNDHDAPAPTNGEETPPSTRRSRLVLHLPPRPAGYTTPKR
jgi:hypothetical protein